MTTDNERSQVINKERMLRISNCNNQELADNARFFLNECALFINALKERGASVALEVTFFILKEESKSKIYLDKDVSLDLKVHRTEEY